MDTAPTLSDALIACGLACAVAYGSHRRSWLSTSGAWTAFAVGAATFASGWRVTSALLTFFFSSALVAKLARTSRTAGSLADEQSSARGAHQVLAVGAFPALAALLGAFTGDVRWLWGAMCALGFATSDTWATDGGQTYPGSPRLLGFGREIPPGQSGGVTLRGTLSGLAGAALIAGLAAASLKGGLRSWFLVTGSGFGGMLLDSILGAAVQLRGTCPVCGKLTERREHCGQKAVLERGGLSNEGVNLVCSGASLWLGWVLLG